MNKKVKCVLVIVYLLTILIMLVGATFAYFSAIQVSSVTPTVQGTTATTDWLILTMGENIYISADDTNFGIGMKSLRDSTYANIELQVVNQGVEVSYTYNIYLNIDVNDFVYTVNEDTPELLLVVRDPDGNVLKNISGLEYKTVQDGYGDEHEGFDITGKTGQFFLAKDYIIKSSNVTSQTWQIEVILVNLDSSQDINVGKVVNAYLQAEGGM